MFSMFSLFASMLLSIVQYGEERSLQALVVTWALKILDCPWRKEYSARVSTIKTWQAMKQFNRMNSVFETWKWNAREIANERKIRDLEDLRWVEDINKRMIYPNI